MRTLLFSILMTLGPAAMAEDVDVFAGEIAQDLADYKWTHRPIVVFADSANDPAYIEQIDMLKARQEELARRDVIVLTDTDPDAESALRKKLRPRGFSMVLIGKDGMVKLRKPFPWDVREISRSIDKMPMRLREIREGG